MLNSKRIEKEIEEKQETSEKKRAEVMTFRNPPGASILTCSRLGHGNPSPGSATSCLRLRVSLVNLDASTIIPMDDV